jgi:hypothetical protein
LPFRIPGEIEGEGESVQPADRRLAWTAREGLVSSTVAFHLGAGEQPVTAGDWSLDKKIACFRDGSFCASRTVSFAVADCFVAAYIVPRSAISSWPRRQPNLLGTGRWTSGPGAPRLSCAIGEAGKKPGA